MYENYQSVCLNCKGHFVLSIVLTCSLCIGHRDCRCTQGHTGAKNWHTALFIVPLTVELALINVAEEYNICIVHTQMCNQLYSLFSQITTLIITRSPKFSRDLSVSNVYIPKF